MSWNPYKSHHNQRRLSEYETLMRKFSKARRDDRVKVALPKVERGMKQFPTGSQYEGTWDLFGMSGTGIYTFPNGVIYKGEFDDGIFHGLGELRYPDGQVLKGKFHHGRMVERSLIFSNGLCYDNTNWKYCKTDRRFAIELNQGVQPAGRSILTADQPTRQIPPNHYDTEDGFYDTVTKTVHKRKKATAVLRCPSEKEQQWTIENCRSAENKPLGPRPDLYEDCFKLKREDTSKDPKASNDAKAVGMFDLDISDTTDDEDDGLVKMIGHYIGIYSTDSSIST